MNYRKIIWCMGSSSFHGSWMDGVFSSNTYMHVSSKPGSLVACSDAT
jgi:hypothetical protein